MLNDHRCWRQARRFGDVAEFRHLQGLRGVYRGVVPRLQPGGSWWQGDLFRA